MSCARVARHLFKTVPGPSRREYFFDSVWKSPVVAAVTTFGFPHSVKIALRTLFVSTLWISCQILANPLETVRVVGTRTALGEAALSGQITVLDRALIEALNKTSVQALLNSLAGVSVNQQGGAGGVTSFYIRGGEANFAVVLIDGIQVNNPADTRGGAFDFSTLDPAQIERIELIRGPQSAVYGADALSGVLNIITRQPATERRLSISAAVGDDAYYRGVVRAAAGFGGAGRYDISVGYRDSGGVVASSERELGFLNGSLAWDFSADTTVGLGYRYSDSERAAYPEDSGGPDYAVWDALERGDSEDLSLQLRVNSRVTQSWDYQLTGDWFSIAADEHSPGIFPGIEVPPVSAKTHFDRYQLGWVNRLQASSLELGLGLDFEREQGDNRGYIDYGLPLDVSFELERDTYGAFAELHYDLGAGLRLSGALRYDAVKRADSEATTRLGLLWQWPNGVTELRANWGQGFKPPSFFALAHPLVGNAGLDSETSSSWDIGWRQVVNDKLSLNLVYFAATYRDLIDFDDELFTNVNRDRVETKGLEFSAQLETGNSGQWRVHASWMDSNIVNVDQELRGRPQWKAGMQWLYDMTSTLQASVEYLRMDEVVEASRHTLQSVDYRLDAYHTLDLGLNWRVTPRLRLRAAVSNVLDEHYQQAVGFTAAGVFPYLAIKWRG